MNIWVDAQLPPTLANWLIDNFDIEAVALRDLGLQDVQEEKRSYESANNP